MFTIYIYHMYSPYISHILTYINHILDYIRHYQTRLPTINHAFLYGRQPRLPPLPSEDPAARNGRCDGCNEGNISCSVVQLPWRQLSFSSFSSFSCQWGQFEHWNTRKTKEIAGLVKFLNISEFWMQKNEKDYIKDMIKFYIIVHHQVAAFWSPKNLIWRFVAGRLALGLAWPIYRTADCWTGWTVGRSPRMAAHPW